VVGRAAGFAHTMPLPETRLRRRSQIMTPVHIEHSWAYFNRKLAWFLDRGWAVLVPDYRGSTGWGRAYTQALRHRWGDGDAADVVAGIEAAHAAGWADRARTRTVVMGGSAGGFTALPVLARRPGLCRAGIVLYPVVDLVHLAATTHRYEAHYNDSLVGPADDLDTATARSPLTIADRISDPLLVLHGTDDVVVLPEQSRQLAARVGGPVEHHEYEGEGHGWSRPATTEDELTRISSFLGRYVLG
jgi:dipeptidyl aminopeptidase/acylaminoacyl peptidase